LAKIQQFLEDAKKRVESFVKEESGERREITKEFARGRY